VREKIGLLRTVAKPEDLAFIFLSSHGSPRSLDPNGVSYIMMNDTDLENQNTRYVTSLQMVDLVEDLKREVRALRVVLVIDTCFSGDATSVATGAKRLIPIGGAAENGWGAASVSPIAAELASGTGRAIISASRANEESWESSEFRNGYFTHFFLEALTTNKD